MVEKKDYKGVTTPVELDNGYIKTTTKTFPIGRQRKSLPTEVDAEHSLSHRWNQCQLPQGRLWQVPD